MSILDRLNLLIRSNLNDSLGRHGSKSARRALSDMESSLRDARRRQAELRRDEKRLIEQIRDEGERAEQWEDRAMLALRSDDEELAREALLVKNKAVNKARQLRDQLDDHRAHMQDIERALEALEHKLEGTRSKMRALSDDKQQSSSSSRRASSSGDGAGAKWDERLRKRSESRRGSTSTPPDPEVSESFDTSGTFREMDRMASKIDGMEAEIEAMRELDDIGTDSRRAELEQKFRSLEGRGRSRRQSSDTERRRRSDEPPLDDDLADLKKKFE